MRIVKNVIGTLEIDSNSKTVYVNSLDKCLLRLTKLKFLNFNEKFSMLDGSVDEGVSFIQDPLSPQTETEKVLPRIISLVSFLLFAINSGKVSNVDKFLLDFQKQLKKTFCKNMEVEKAMTILSDLLNEMKSNDEDEILRKICDKIYEQQPKSLHSTFLPVGPNIFLALECPEDFQKYNFLCIEREEKNTFIVSHWTRLKKESTVTKRSKVWDCKEMSNQKIIEMYLEKFKFLRGN
jgi:hypothetical protein